MKILQAVWQKEGEFWRVVRWDVIGHVPGNLSGADAIAWAKENGYAAPVLE